MPSSGRHEDAETKAWSIKQGRFRKVQVSQAPVDFFFARHLRHTSRMSQKRALSAQLLLFEILNILPLVAVYSNCDHTMMSRTSRTCIFLPSTVTRPDTFVHGYFTLHYPLQIVISVEERAVILYEIDMNCFIQPFITFAWWARHQPPHLRRPVLQRNSN
jgi:hypothetical protein